MYDLYRSNCYFITSDRFDRTLELISALLHSKLLATFHQFGFALLEADRGSFQGGVP